MYKTLLLTGATGGIGEKIAEKFAHEGYALALLYHDNESKAAQMQEMYGCPVYKADISNKDEADRAVNSAVEELGHVDVLINNAGIALRQKLITEITDEEFDKVFAVNVKGAFNCIKSVLPSMIHRRSGAIINISSVWGVCGASCETVYSASKAAVIGLTKALSKEVSTCNIRVNCVAPGMIDTQMNAHLSDSDKEQLRADTPLQRLGTAQDVANACYFLSTEEFITAQTIVVDGGFIS